MPYIEPGTDGLTFLAWNKGPASSLFPSHSFRLFSFPPVATCTGSSALAAMQDTWPPTRHSDWRRGRGWERGRGTRRSSGRIGKRDEEEEEEGGGGGGGGGRRRRRMGRGRRGRGRRRGEEEEEGDKEE